jgi:hypothetical protein
MSTKVVNISLYQDKLKNYNEKLSNVEDLFNRFKDSKDIDDSQELISKIKSMVDLTQALIKLKEFEQVKKEKETFTKKPLFEDIQKIAAEKGFYIGMQCEAKYFEDDQWYKATINNFNEYGVVVKFSEYGNKETVYPENIRQRQEMILTENMKRRKRKAVESASASTLDEKGDLIIPESLRILDTDSEPERKEKKRRIRSIKSKNRLKKSEETRNKRKDSWKTFQKVGSKKVKGSIFQSPDSISGKVGVTGSGKQMTNFVVPKYKPKKINSNGEEEIDEDNE